MGDSFYNFRDHYGLQQMYLDCCRTCIHLNLRFLHFRVALKKGGVLGNFHEKDKMTENASTDDFMFVDRSSSSHGNHFDISTDFSVLWCNRSKIAKST